MIEFWRKWLYFSRKKDFPFFVTLGLALPVAALVASVIFPIPQPVLWCVFSAIALLNIMSVYTVNKRVLSPLSESVKKVKWDENALNLNETSAVDAIDYIIDYSISAKQQEYSLLLLQKQAEIDSLQSQINPHFLYNTLDSIRGQALAENAPHTYDMVESLSRLLRYTISQKNDMITLREELDSVENYLKIQRFRFLDRFDLNIVVTPEDEFLLKHKIPKLTIQPIIENSIYHGLPEVVSGGLIEISISATQSRLIITITDNGAGIREEDLNSINKRLQTLEFDLIKDGGGAGHGVALHNVNARIKLIYGNAYGLTLYSALGQGTQVEIVMPLLEDAYEL